VRERDLFQSSTRNADARGIDRVIQGKVEEIQLPNGVDKVDIIISEWMVSFKSKTIIERNRNFSSDAET
jgi:hypothetical protein